MKLSRCQCLDTGGFRRTGVILPLIASRAARGPGWQALIALNCATRRDGRAGPHFLRLFERLPGVSQKIIPPFAGIEVVGLAVDPVNQRQKLAADLRRLLDGRFEERRPGLGVEVFAAGSRRLLTS